MNVPGMNRPAIPAPGGSSRSVFLYTLFIFALWSIYVAKGYGRVEQLGPIASPLANELVRALIFALPAVVLLRAAGVSSIPAYLELRSNAKQGVLWGALAGCALFAANAGLAIASQGFHPRPVPTVAFFTSLSVATFIEEMAFRGFLLQQLSALTRFSAANVGSAFLFAAIHIPGWLLVDGAAIYPDKIVPLASIFALGLILGLLFRRTGSLWTCVLVHASNNLASIILPAT